MKSDLPTRALVGAVLIVAAATVLWLGGVIFWLALALVGLLMLAEWADLAGASARQQGMAQIALAVVLVAMLVLLRQASAALAAFPFPLDLLHYDDKFVLIPALWTALLSSGLLVLAVMLVMAALVAWFGGRRMGLGLLYVGLPVLALLVLRMEGLLLTFWAMALVWACDIGAYFAGRALGGPKLAPRISPNKTWSGLGGGVLAATLFALLLHVRLGLPLPLVLATPLLAVAAQLGDLYESHLKRRAGVKDSGTILPGHGGLMDRLDGLVPVAPLAALLVLGLH